MEHEELVAQVGARLGSRRLGAVAVSSVRDLIVDALADSVFLKVAEVGADIDAVN